MIRKREKGGGSNGTTLVGMRITLVCVVCHLAEFALVCIGTYQSH